MTSTEVAATRHCTVDIDMLKTYKDATEHSSPCPHTFERGDHISYTNVKVGEDINRNGHHTNQWGYQPDIKAYFWLGGTTDYHPEK